MKYKLCPDYSSAPRLCFSHSRALSLRNLVSGYECGGVFPAGVGPGSPSRDAASWLPSRFGLSVETRRQYGWLRMVFSDASLEGEPGPTPAGKALPHSYSTGPLGDKKHLFGPRFFNIPFFCTMFGLEKLGTVDQNWLERIQWSDLLLRTLVVGRRQQSESIEAALDMEYVWSSHVGVRKFDELVGAIACRVA